MALEIRDDRQNRALLGLSKEKYEQLVSTFEQVYDDVRVQACQADLTQGKRQRNIPSKTQSLVTPTR